MKTYQSMHKYFALTAVAALLMWASPLSAKDYDYKKDFDKSYSVNANATLELETSFGDVEVNNWEKNEISIHVEVEVDAKSESAAEKVFDRIEVVMSGNSNRVTLKTDINKGDNNGDFSINIVINMPATGAVEIDHSFGSCEIADVQGKSEITVSYGDLEAGKLANVDNDITVEFGNGEIKEIGGGDITVEFGELEIGKINGDCDIRCSYGNLEIDYISNKCKNLDISSDFGEVDITLASDANFTIEANSSFGGVDLPGKATIVNKDKDFMSESIEAKIGSGSGGSIDINCSFGNVEIDID